MEESRKIRVFLDGKPINLFKGMKVKHILTHEMVEKIKEGSRIVVDEEGNERGLEGSLTDGEHLKIEAIAKSP